MRFEIVTIFPEFFTSIFENGILRRALAEGLVTVGVHDLRVFTHDRHRTVDDRPFGGGEGMVLKPEPLAEALASLGIAPKAERQAGDDAQTHPRVILLSAQGRPFTQAMARELAATERVVLICGRYEGVDERVNVIYCDMELSIGDYVLTNGALPAMVVIDAVTRLLPGALGDDESSHDESFSHGLLEYPQYTRPAEFRGTKVPDVLVSGHHAEIEKWRREQAKLRTKERRPDLMK